MKLLWIVAVAPSLLAGCEGPRMAMPGGLSGAEELAVADRSRATGLLVNEGFRLGPFTIAEVDRDWDSSSGFAAGPWSKETKTTGYAFELRGGKTPLGGKCASEHKSQGLLGGTFSWGDTTVACSCEGAGEKAELVLSDQGNSAKLGGKEYAVTPVFDVAGGGTQSDAVGFRLDGDEVLGAAEVVYPGHVWLRQGVSELERQQAACLFAGLMLYQPPSED